MNEPASQYIPKPSAVSTGQLIDSEKYQELSNAEPKDDAPWLDTTYDGFNGEVLKIGEKFMETHDKALKQLAEIER